MRTRLPIPCMSPAERIRFFSYVDRTSGDCWLWVGSRDRAGYGRFNLAGRRWSAHRVSLNLFRGIPEDSEDVDHLCRNRACVNPVHLEAVTHAENIARGNTGKHFSARTQCANGHDYNDENTRWARDPAGYAYRICRACMRIYVARSRRKAKES